MQGQKASVAFRGRIWTHSSTIEIMAIDLSPYILSEIFNNFHKPQMSAFFREENKIIIEWWFHNDVHCLPRKIFHYRMNFFFFCIFFNTDLFSLQNTGLFGRRLDNNMKRKGVMKSDRARYWKKRRPTHTGRASNSLEAVFEWVGGIDKGKTQSITRKNMWIVLLLKSLTTVFFIPSKWCQHFKHKMLLQMA